VNRPQEITLLVGLGLATALVCVPPWKYTFPGTLRIERPGPYALVFAPPEVPPTEYFLNKSRDRWTVEIDLQRLLLPVVPVLVLTLVLLYLFRTPKS